MITHETYECSICHKIYDSAEKASECEKWDKTCHCQRARYYIFSRYIMGYGRAASVYIDFEDKIIAGRYPTAVDQHYEAKENAAHIRYCPFCGKEL